MDIFEIDYDCQVTPLQNLYIVVMAGTADYLLVRTCFRSDDVANDVNRLLL